MYCTLLPLPAFILLRISAKEKHPQGCSYLPVLRLCRFRAYVMCLILIFRLFLLSDAVKFFFCFLLILLFLFYSVHKVLPPAARFSCTYRSVFLSKIVVIRSLILLSFRARTSLFSCSVIVCDSVRQTIQPVTALCCSGSFLSLFHFLHILG